MKIRNFILSLLLVVTISSCNKNEECDCNHGIYNVWEVKSFMSIESVLYAKDNDYNPIIEFKANGELSIQLDANSCFGSFNLGNNNEIEIGNAGCTEMCCDSDFSMKFVEMLPQVTSFTIEGNNMKLNVPEWGWIELELVLY